MEENLQSLGVPRVVFHGFLEDDAKSSGSYGRSNIDAPTDVTQYVTNLSWTHSLSAPWETINVKLTFPQNKAHQIMPGLPRYGSEVTGDYGRKGMDNEFNQNSSENRRYFRQPCPGFWVVLYLPNKTHPDDERKKPPTKDIQSAICWGRVEMVNTELRSDPKNGRLMTTMTLKTESWLSWLNKCRFVVTADDSIDWPGVAAPLGSWAPTMAAMLKGQVNQHPGQLLQRVFRMMAHQAFPNSLGGFTGDYYQFFDGRSGWQFGYNYNKDNVANYVTGMMEAVGPLRGRDAQAKQAFLNGTPLSGALARSKFGKTLSDMQLRAREGSNRPWRVRDIVKVVWSRHTCTMYAPLRVLQHKRVSGTGLRQIGDTIPRGSVGSFLSNTFKPTDVMLEYFASLEWPAFPIRKRQRAAQLIDDDETAIRDNMAGDGTLFAEQRDVNNVMVGGKINYNILADFNRAGGFSSEESFQLTPIPGMLENRDDFAMTDLRDMQNSGFANTGLYNALSITSDNKVGGGWYNCHSVVNDIPMKNASKPSKGTDTLGLDFIRNGLGGSQPVLMYRTKPKQFVAINHVEATKILRLRMGPWAEGAFYAVSHRTKSENIGLNQFVLVHPYQSATELDHWYTYSADRVKSISITWDDNERVNAVYLKPTEGHKSQMETYGMMGNPLLQNNDIYKHGLRLKDPDYPFHPVGMAQEQYQDSQLNDIFDCLNEEGFQQLSCNDEQAFFGSGSVEIKYCPWIQAGHWCGGQFPEDQAWRQEKARLNAEALGGFQDDTAQKQAMLDPGFAGYITSVTHTISIDPQEGKINATTSLNLSDVSMVGTFVLGYSVPMYMDWTVYKRARDSDTPFVVLSDGGYQFGAIKRQPDGSMKFTPDPDRSVLYNFDMDD